MHTIAAVYLIFLRSLPGEGSEPDFRYLANFHFVVAIVWVLLFELVNSLFDGKAFSGYFHGLALDFVKRGV